MFSVFCDLSDLASTALNSKYSYWANVHENNDLIATTDGHANMKYAIEVKTAFYLSFTFPLALALLIATGSPALAALPFAYNIYQLLPIAAENWLLLSRYHHFLHP